MSTCIGEHVTDRNGKVFHWIRRGRVESSSPQKMGRRRDENDSHFTKIPRSPIPHILFYCKDPMRESQPRPTPRSLPANSKTALRLSRRDLSPGGQRISHRCNWLLVPTGYPRSHSRSRRCRCGNFRAESGKTIGATNLAVPYRCDPTILISLCMSWFKTFKKPHKPSKHPLSGSNAAPQIGAGPSVISAKSDRGIGSQGVLRSANIEIGGLHLTVTCSGRKQ